MLLGFSAAKHLMFVDAVPFVIVIYFVLTVWKAVILTRLIHILFYSILFYSILFYIILFYSILYYFFYVILFYFILFYSLLYYFFYIILFYSILFYSMEHTTCCIQQHFLCYDIQLLFKETVNTEKSFLQDKVCIRLIQANINHQTIFSPCNTLNFVKQLRNNIRTEGSGLPIMRLFHTLYRKDSSRAVSRQHKVVGVTRTSRF